MFYGVHNKVTGSLAGLPALAVIVISILLVLKRSRPM
jgi:hypothetical protein